MSTKDPVHAARAKLAAATRFGHEDVATEARGELYIAMAERRVLEAIRGCSPIPAGRRAELAAMLLDGGVK